MNGSWKKIGLKVLLITIILLVLAGRFDVPSLYRLAFGTFGIGTATFLIFFGGLQPPEDL